MTRLACTAAALLAAVLVVRAWRTIADGPLVDWALREWNEPE